MEYVPEVLVEYNVGHGYDRDSALDADGVRNAIESTEVKFEKFPDAFERYPEMYASNLAYIGAGYLMLGDVRRGANYFGTALRVDPTTWRVYFQLARVLKFYVDRHLPVLGAAVDRRLKR